RLRTSGRRDTAKGHRPPVLDSRREHDNGPATGRGRCRVGAACVSGRRQTVRGDAAPNTAEASTAMGERQTRRARAGSESVRCVAPRTTNDPPARTRTRRGRRSAPTCAPGPGRATPGWQVDPRPFVRLAEATRPRGIRTLPRVPPCPSLPPVHGAVRAPALLPCSSIRSLLHRGLTSRDLLPTKHL